MFVNEVDNDPATQAVEVVMNYIKKNPALGISVQLMPVEGNRTDSKKFLENSKFTVLKIQQCMSSCRLLHPDKTIKTSILDMVLCWLSI